MPGPSVFPSREPRVSRNFCGRIKGVKYRFALKDGTWDFPGDARNFGPGSQASSRGEAKDSALLSSRDAGLLEPPVLGVILSSGDTG